ncbi:hypothetical protein BX600DRAFT_21680 [Xylariales sp. PMI_506]|nr:hypothetical protein BX600DRAFT_21680 [Xylariales sp. PMI_506]
MPIPSKLIRCDKWDVFSMFPYLPRLHVVAPPFEKALRLVAKELGAGHKMCTPYVGGTVKFRWGGQRAPSDVRWWAGTVTSPLYMHGMVWDPLPSSGLSRSQHRATGCQCFASPRAYDGKALFCHFRVRCSHSMASSARLRPGQRDLRLLGSEIHPGLFHSEYIRVTSRPAFACCTGPWIHVSHVHRRSPLVQYFWSFSIVRSLAGRVRTRAVSCTQPVSTRLCVCVCPCISALARPAANDQPRLTCLS